MAEKNAMLVMRDVSKTFNPGTVNEKCALKNLNPVSYTHLRAHETDSYLVCRLLLEKKKKKKNKLNIL